MALLELSRLPTTSFALVVMVSLGVCILLTSRTRNKSKWPYPPGPRPHFIIGNYRDFHTVQPWVTYTRWQKEYGDIVYGYTMGQHVIILNSLKVIADLVEKRSHIYSDRPLLPMRDIMGWKFVLGLMHFGDTWKKHRRILRQKYRPDVAIAYRPSQLRGVHELLRNLLSDPDDFIDHCKYMASTIIMETAYGYRPMPKGDKFLENAERAIVLMANLMFPGASIVNSIPFLRYLPSWFPGGQFHQDAEECRSLTAEMLNKPYNLVKKNMASGTGPVSLISELIEENERAGGSAEEEMIKGLGATIFSAGADTVAGAVESFFLAAATSPVARRKAQAELDKVIGRDRLPSFEDRASLPYIEAFYREVMRWRPTLPTAVAHATIEDDVYEGYFIPKGATILCNIWAMTHDEEKYHEPYLFNPDRFFTAEGILNNDSTILAFGFGKRICIGQHAADATVWLTIVSVLWAFDFENATDANGRVIPIEGKYTDAVISHVIPFKCSIFPRDKDAKHLMEATSTS